MNYIPKFDETGHLNYYDDNTKPSYKELTDMLQDCVNLLNEIDIDDLWFETYSNVIMNAETMLFKIT